MTEELKKTIKEAEEEIDKRVLDKILEPSNAELLKKLINQAESVHEAISIKELGTSYKMTGLHFDKRLDKIVMGDTIKFLKKNETLSFGENPKNKLIIGDNYDALQNLLIMYRNKVDVIYIDPPYSKDKMGNFAKENYENNISRDNLLSQLYPRLELAKKLLSRDGVIFCSIDDKNQAYVKCLFDEIFGENHFLFCIPRITKKGGKTTQTIQKNSDYILAYTISDEVVFNQMEKDLSSYTLEDEYVETRGKYKVSQCLDYDSLSYSKSLDYPLEIDGKTYYPGGSKEEYEKRQNGNAKTYDWTWRWSKSSVEWGLKEGFIVIKGDRIYTKTYTNCRKKNKENAIEYCDATKAYTSLSFIENKFSNDSGKKELDTIIDNSDKVFKNPKPSVLISELINMVNSDPNSVILDFYAGSGTTGHAVLELNRQDNGNRTFILCTNNETSEMNPNGIAYDVTTKRLKRIMTGECYDKTNNFKWLKDNKPYLDSLEVTEIQEVSNSEYNDGKSAFDLIDESIYKENRFENRLDKINWICKNFENTQYCLENEDETRSD